MQLVLSAGKEGLDLVQVGHTPGTKGGSNQKGNALPFHGLAGLLRPLCDIPLLIFHGWVLCFPGKFLSFQLSSQKRMKEKCSYHYIIKDTIKPPLSQERWEVFSLFFKKSPPKEQAFVRLSHPDRGKGPAHRTPGRGRRWAPILRQKGESPPLSPPFVSFDVSAADFGRGSPP